MKQYTVYADGQHHVIEGESHKITSREHDSDTLKIMRDGETVFETYGYFSFTAEPADGYGSYGRYDFDPERA